MLCLLVCHWTSSHRKPTPAHGTESSLSGCIRNGPLPWPALSSRPSDASSGTSHPRPRAQTPDSSDLRWESQDNQYPQVRAPALGPRTGLGTARSVAGFASEPSALGLLPTVHLQLPALLAASVPRPEVSPSVNPQLPRRLGGLLLSTLYKPVRASPRFPLIFFVSRSE